MSEVPVLIPLVASLCLTAGSLGAQVPAGAGGIHTTRPHVDWQVAGPGGGGWLTSITIADDADATMYVACDVGGVYKSSDHGASWQIKDKGLGIYYVEDIAYDPVVTDTLYVATRGGIYKSTNGGDLWVAKRAGFPPVADFSFSAPISDIVVDRVNPGILYAGVGVLRAGYVLDSYAWQAAGVKGAIYKSTDFGESWALIQGTGIDPTAMIYSLAIDPANSNVVLAATSMGVYKSTSAGATWTAINNGLPSLRAMALVIDPSNSSVIYTTQWAEPGAGTWSGGVYKSVDGGAHWAAKNSGLPQVVGLEPELTSNYPNLVIDPQNPQILYAGHNPWTPDPGVYKSTDGGGSWTWITQFQPPNPNVDMGWITEHGPFSRCLAIDPQDPARLLFGTATHLFKTENAGATWAQTISDHVGAGYWRGRGFETTVVADIVVDPTNSSRVYAGYWDMGFLKSIDGGVSFKRTFTGMHYGSNAFSIVVDPGAPSIVYAATGWWETNQGEVTKSLDFGETWTPLTSGLPDAQVWSIALVPAPVGAASTLYATSADHGLYKTTNGGQSWSSVSNGLGLPGNLQVRTVAVDPNNPKVLFVGLVAKQTVTGGISNTIQGGLFRSADGGASWARLDAAVPQLSVWDIVIDPSNSRIVYTAVSGGYDHSLGITYPGGVYRSEDDGVTWSLGARGMGNPIGLDVQAVALSPADSRTLYAVTNDAPFHDLSSGRGIFVSHNNGRKWTAINDGLGVLNFSAITVDPNDDSRLYAGSNGNGIQIGDVW